RSRTTTSYERGKSPATARMSSMSTGMFSTVPRSSDVDLRPVKHPTPRSPLTWPQGWKGPLRPLSLSGFGVPVAPAVVETPKPGRERLGGLALELESDVDELVLLAADELAPPRANQDLRAGDVVALGLPVRVLEEARVHARIAHHQRHP